MLPAFLRAPGIGASPQHLKRRLLPLLLAIALLAPLAASALAPAPASALTGTCTSNPGFGFNTGSPVKRTLTSTTLSVIVRGLSLNGTGCEAQWTIEWSTSPNGPWQPFPGGTGTCTEQQAKEEGEVCHSQTGELTGLEPEITYYIRGLLEPTDSFDHELNGDRRFETKPLHPFGASLKVEPSSVTETSAHLIGAVVPAPFETHWRFEYSASKSALENGEGTLVSQGTISQAEAEAAQTAVLAHPIFAEADLTGLSPDTAYYLRAVAEDEPEWPPSSGQLHHGEFVSAISTFNQGSEFETHGPPTAEASGVPALRGETIRLLGYVVPHGYDTHYRFQYGESKAYGSETPEEDAGSGGGTGLEATAAAADLPGLTPGRTYHYRILATGGSAGTTVVPGADHTLTVPLPGEGGEEAPGPCPNEALRTGPSARLHDCRAYEQVTPAEKGGAQQAFGYANQLSNFGALVGEDGDHLVYEHPLVHWGSGQGPYFFSRSPGGWQLTPGAAQPEAGYNLYTAELFNPDLTRFAFSAGWTSKGGIESPQLEFKAGPPGGPYPLAASVPRAQARLEGNSLGWVAASEDFSKLILASTDRTLAGPATATASGADLYEYEPASGALRQANVDTAGATVGSCGATVVRGPAEPGGTNSTGIFSTPHALSADGSRLFFLSSAPGKCATAEEQRNGFGPNLNLYMRLNGTETTDLGPYRFLAANSQGTELLLEAPGADTQQVVLYETETAAAKTLLTLHEHHPNSAENLNVRISADFSTLYLVTREQLTPDAPPPTGGAKSGSTHDVYRYNLASEALRFVFQRFGEEGLQLSPDGRYLTTIGSLTGLPHTGLFGENLIFYDSVHNLVECASCASPYDPEPQWDVARLSFANSGVLPTRNGSPGLFTISNDGRRLFFDTIAALLPSDVDGEAPPRGGAEGYSESSDVYEWRANGTEGCLHVQGCLALVSTGRGGHLVQLLGADPSGRDVFFTTAEHLVPSDQDTSIDVYDARSGGGFPPPPQRPVECQGDACSTPVPAPNDPTPASEQFHGAGNVHETPAHHKHHKKRHHKKAHKRHAKSNRGGHK